MTQSLLRFSATAFLFLLCCNAFPQSWQWAQQVYGPNKDEILCVETDPWNNVYIGGRFRDTVRFAPTVFFTTSVGYFDGFIAKYDSSGNFLWARTWGGNADDWVSALSIDDSGYVYLAGYGRSTNPIIYDSFSYQGTGNDKTYILKINPQGNLVWGKPVTHGISNAYPASISVNNGLLAITGNYGFLNMVIETDTLFLRGSDDIFLATYNAANGALLWTKALRSQYMDYAYDVVVDDSANVYTAGIHNGSLNIGGADSLMSPAGYEGFICKHNASGAYKWSRRWRGTGDHMIDGLRLSPTGAVYIAGWHSSGNHTLNDTTFTMLYTYNFFLQKISPGGSSLWTRHYHGNSLGRIIGMACDPFDNVYFAGYLGSQYNIDTFQITGSSSNYKAFLARISGSGIVLHALTGGDAVNNAGYNNVAADNQGNAYVVGYFGTTLGQQCVFGNDTLISKGSSDGFLARYSPASPPPCTVSASFTSTHSFVCFPDSVIFFSTSQNATQIQWLVNGLPAGNNPYMELTVFFPGTYTVQLIASNSVCSDTSTMTITAPPAQITTFYDTICQGDTLMFGGILYTTTGTYTTNFPVSGGCDSSHILYLHVNPAWQLNRFDTICHGDTLFIYNGQQALFTSGIYTETLQTAAGCDSITLFNLHVNPAWQLNRFDTICHGDTLFIYNGQQALFTSGIYTETLQTAAGCDSVTIYHIYKDSIVAGFSINGNIATAPSGFAYYQWLNCDLGLIPVTGAVNPVFTATLSGNYAVVIGSGLCTDTSQCQYILVNSIKKENKGGRISLFPNPASTSINVSVSDELKVKRAKVYSAQGNLLKDVETKENHFLIDLYDVSPGLLFLIIHTDIGVSVMRFVME